VTLDDPSPVVGVLEADRVRDELRVALNAVKHARRLLEADGWRASEVAWQELDSLTAEVDEINGLATDPGSSPAQAVLDALKSSSP
jgi:hypothetical protein